VSPSISVSFTLGVTFQHLGTFLSVFVVEQVHGVLFLLNLASELGSNNENNNAQCLGGGAIQRVVIQSHFDSLIDLELHITIPFL